MRTIIFIYIFVFIALPIYAQNDGVSPHTYTRAINLKHQSPFTTDSIDVLTPTVTSVIERVYWNVDTLLVAVDSLQLRVGESQIVVSTFIDTGDGEVESGESLQLSVPNHPIYSNTTLRIVLFGTEEALAGQFRIIIVYREIY